MTTDLLIAGGLSALVIAAVASTRQRRTVANPSAVVATGLLIDDALKLARARALTTAAAHGRPAPHLRLPWLDAPLGFLTGELVPRGVAVDILAAETERARVELDAAFQARGGPGVYPISRYRSFDEQAEIVRSVLGPQGINASSDVPAIRRALLLSLQTRAIPGFSRHHWGTEVDVLSADADAWKPGGSAAPYVQPLIALAPAYGLYHPYRDGAFPEPTRPHYAAEPWHLSLAAPAETLRQRWLREIGDDPMQYDALLRRAANAIASRVGADPERVRQALASIDLRSYVRNVAPVPTELSA